MRLVIPRNHKFHAPTSFFRSAVEGRFRFRHNAAATKSRRFILMSGLWLHNHSNVRGPGVECVFRNSYPTINLSANLSAVRKLQCTFSMVYCGERQCKSPFTHFFLIPGHRHFSARTFQSSPCPPCICSRPLVSGLSMA